MSVSVSGYLKTSLVEIASAVGRMVLPVDPNFEKDQVAANFKHRIFSKYKWSNVLPLWSNDHDG